MDALGSFLTAEIIRSLGEGNLSKFLAYLLIFMLLWFQLRGLKKEFHALNSTISKSFKEGETRFDKAERRQEMVENKQLEFEHRLTVLENHTQP